MVRCQGRPPSVLTSTLRMPPDGAEVDATGDVVGVETLWQHVDGGGGQPCPFEHDAQRDTAPARDADGAEQPRGAGHGLVLLRGEETSPVAGALDARGDCL